MTSKVDLLVVMYNCKHLIPLFVSSLRNISIPVTVYFLDNGSQDGTADAVAPAQLGRNATKKKTPVLRKPSWPMSAAAVAPTGGKPACFESTASPATCHTLPGT